eukprot:7376026-Prymnesium_polylepis.1
MRRPTASTTPRRIHRPPPTTPGEHRERSTVRHRYSNAERRHVGLSQVMLSAGTRAWGCRTPAHLPRLRVDIDLCPAGSHIDNRHLPSVRGQAGGEQSSIVPALQKAGEPFKALLADAGRARLVDGMD